MMKIAYLTHNTADVFYRIGQYLDTLHANGVSPSILRTPKNPFMRFMTLKSLSGYDAVVIQRRLFGSFWRALLKRYARKLILDIDDAVMIPSNELGSHSSIRMRRYKGMVGLSSLVMAGNSYLRDLTLEICPDARVSIVPTVVDTDQYLVKQHERKQPVIVGWIGSSSTIRYLSMVENVLRDIVHTREEVVFRIVSNEFPDYDWAEKIPWSRQREKEDVVGFDIGIMPLPDSPWTRGKCGFKLIQYMAAGLPVVASPVGANKDIVLHSHTGFLAADEMEWARFLGDLIDSADLRASLGMNGRKRAEEFYSLNRIAPRYLSLISEVVR